MADLRIRFTLLYAVVSLSSTGLVLSVNGPPVSSKRHDSDYTVRIGDNLQLRCPLTSQPVPLYQWSKNGETINTGWVSIKLRDDLLQIKNVEKSDSGDYVCEATNGFGTSKADFSVCVLGNDSSTESDVDHCNVSPSLIHDGSLSPQNIEIGVGQSAQLSCAARGKPAPNFRWAKDGNYISNQNTDKFIFSLNQVKRQDGGQYICHVYNSAGSVNRTFSVRVRDVTVNEPDERPWFFPSVMNNITVNMGSTARFSCQVYSRDDRTQIRWLKKSSSAMGTYNSNNITSLKQSDVIQVGTEISRVGDTSFTSTLTLERVTTADVGIYICLTFNAHGIQAQEAFLRIATDSTYSGSDSASDITPQYLPIAVAIGSVTGIVLLALVIWLTSRRCAAQSSNKRTPSSTASTTSSPHNSACAAGAPAKSNVSGSGSASRAYPGCGPAPAGVDHTGALLAGYVQPQMTPPLQQPVFNYPLHQQHLIQQQRLLQQPPPSHVDPVQFQYYEQC